MKTSVIRIKSTEKNEFILAGKKKRNFFMVTFVPTKLILHQDIPFWPERSIFRKCTNSKRRTPRSYTHPRGKREGKKKQTVLLGYAKEYLSEIQLFRCIFAKTLKKTPGSITSEKPTKRDKERNQSCELCILTSI